MRRNCFDALHPFAGWEIPGADIINIACTPTILCSSMLLLHGLGSVRFVLLLFVPPEDTSLFQLYHCHATRLYSTISSSCSTSSYSFSSLPAPSTQTRDVQCGLKEVLAASGRSQPHSSHTVARPPLVPVSPCGYAWYMCTCG